jgi:hypothetical protein
MSTTHGSPRYFRTMTKPPGRPPLTVGYRNAPCSRHLEAGRIGCARCSDDLRYSLGADQSQAWGSWVSGCLR